MTNQVANDVEEDPRFKVFKKEWFEGKDCLDVGCNSGLMTINIGKDLCSGSQFSMKVLISDSFNSTLFCSKEI